MLKYFLISAFILGLTSFAGTIISGGALFDSTFFSFNLLLFCLLSLILVFFIFISGFTKPFIKIFLTKKHFVKLELAELKQIENALVYTAKVALYEAIFFVCIGTTYYYVNWENTQTLGYQLSLMILAVRYVCSIEILFLSIKAAVKKQIILFMAEDESKDESRKKSALSIAKTLFKTFLFALLIFGLTVFVVQNYTKNESDFDFRTLDTWIDLPSVFLLLVPALLLLLSNGLLKDFISGIKSAVFCRKLNVSEKHKAINALSTARYLILLLALFFVMLGYYAVVTYLEDKSSLGANMQIATVPCFYAVIFNLVLLSVESCLKN